MNKIVSFLRTHIAYVSIFLFILIIFLVLLIDNKSSLSNNELLNEVYIYPDNYNPVEYNYNDGSWILYKNANWINPRRVRLKYTINSNIFNNRKDKDVLFVIDNSFYLNQDYPSNDCSHFFSDASSNNIKKVDMPASSYSQNIFNSIYGITEDINYMNEEYNMNSKAALITFNDSYKIEQDFTNNMEEFLSKFSNIEDSKSLTNYEQALDGIDNILSTYEYNSNRDLIVVMIIGNISSGNLETELSKRTELKNKYPFLKINAIQRSLDYDNQFLNEVINVSDNQFMFAKLYNQECNSSSGPVVSNKDYSIKKTGGFDPYDGLDSISNIMRNIAFDSSYKNFKMIDYLNDDYFVLKDNKIVEVDKGNASIDYKDNNIMVTWDFKDKFVTGEIINLIIELSLKDEVDLTNEFFNTSKRSVVDSRIDKQDNLMDEDIIYSSDTQLSPILPLGFTVHYLAEVPSGCNVQTIPDEKYIVGDKVDISDKKYECDGYQFMGWLAYNYYSSDNDALMWEPIDYNNTYPKRVNFNINNNTFEMPTGDVYLTPTYTKVEVEKMLSFAELDQGTSVNIKIKKVAGETSPSYTTANYSVEYIKRSDSLPDGFVPTEDNTISSNKSDFPIYIWYDENLKTVFFYTKGERLAIKYASYMFRDFRSLKSIEFLYEFDLDLKSPFFDYMFYHCENLESLSGIDNWDTKYVSDMRHMFGGNYNISSLLPLKDWNVSNVRYMQSLFFGDSNLLSLEGLENWNVSKVENMEYTFYNLIKNASLAPLTNWNTSSVKNMNRTFYANSVITSLEGLQNWDVSNVTDMGYMFGFNNRLNDSSQINNWDITKVSNFDHFFYSTPSKPEFTKVSGTWASNGTFTPDSVGGGS